jgi:DNA-binding CsgD family transcriptional regulator
MSSQGAVRLGQILATSSLAGLKAAIVSIARELGFRYVMYRGRFSRLRNTYGEIRIDNCPAAWHRYCLDHGLDSLPGSLRRLALQEVTPVAWQPAARGHSEAFAKARKFGLMTGVTLAVHGPRGQWSLSSFIMDIEGVAAQRRIRAVLPDCQLVACAAHCAASRLVKRRLDAAMPVRRVVDTACPALSDRERQCLIRLAAGKTTSEIAKLLEISERTIVFHLANVREKLGAINSRHAVARAISLNLIAAG